MKWKIIYDHGTYSDEDGPPELAPKRGVQVILIADSLQGRRLEHSSDYFIYTPERGVWRAVDKFGLYDYLIEPGSKIVLFGRVLSNAEFRKIFHESTRDTDLPTKSAFDEFERRP